MTECAFAAAEGGILLLRTFPERDSDQKIEQSNVGWEKWG